jgi:hypothetical protein
MSVDQSTPDLVAIRILGLPLNLFRHSAEHNDELRREFALIHRSGNDDAGVPARLQRLGDELDQRFGAFTAGPTGALHDALERGDERVDLVYEVPAQVKEASIQLGAMLDEADSFCQAGEHLLTLATPPGPLAFRRWFLGEFVAQVDGATPTSWDEYAARSSSPT